MIAKINSNPNFSNVLNSATRIMIHQCRITPAMIKQFVKIYDNTIMVRMQAIRSASLSVLPAFSPRALAQILHALVTAFDNVTIVLFGNFLLQIT